MSYLKMTGVAVVVLSRSVTNTLDVICSIYHLNYIYCISVLQVDYIQVEIHLEQHFTIFTTALHNLCLCSSCAH